MIREINRELLDEMLFQALRAIHQFERRKVALFGCTHAEIYLMQYLRRREDAGVGAIAEEMGFPVSTVSRLLGRLEKRGLVARRKGEKDKRQVRVHLEPAGESLVREVEDDTFDLFSETTGALAEKDTAALVRTLELLSLVLKDPETDKTLQQEGQTK